MQFSLACQRLLHVCVWPRLRLLDMQVRAAYICRYGDPQGVSIPVADRFLRRGRGRRRHQGRELSQRMRARGRPDCWAVGRGVPSQHTALGAHGRWRAFRLAFAHSVGNPRFACSCQMRCLPTRPSRENGSSQSAASWLEWSKMIASILPPMRSVSGRVRLGAVATTVPRRVAFSRMSIDMTRWRWSTPILARCDASM